MVPARASPTPRVPSRGGLLGLPLISEYDERGTRWLYQQPGVQQWWREWSSQVPLEYRDYVDALIREGEAAE